MFTVDGFATVARDDTAYGTVARDATTQETDRAYVLSNFHWYLLQDARYVIHTITFFAVSCPENSAFFRKNRQIFENIPRKILHILNILEKCCILEKSRKKLVKFGENSAFSEKFGKFSKNFQKNV